MKQLRQKNRAEREIRFSKAQAYAETKQQRDSGAPGAGGPRGGLPEEPFAGLRQRAAAAATQAKASHRVTTTLQAWFWFWLCYAVLCCAVHATEAAASSLPS